MGYTKGNELVHGERVPPGGGGGCIIRSVLFHRANFSKA